ncbi:uncharacterized protein EV154DRAFT_556869 [Mucor mucedo]|uniref:uncharacterized protein n=1 Tax=Mucor mucedo TaxID=29922 RepID=UPI002220DDC2|nr:uncharacterized protein EV154DRAFT_556869 [Mucor mucedo]KAI7868197.1 hypothetical protein EV154DRAFT_556869 [Mucor mucedo]
MFIIPQVVPKTSTLAPSLFENDTSPMLTSLQEATREEFLQVYPTKRHMNTAPITATPLPFELPAPAFQTDREPTPETETERSESVISRRRSPPADIVSGHAYYRRLSQAVLQRLNVFHSAAPLNQDVVNGVLRFYVSDVWSMLSTSNQYVRVRLVQLRRFQDTHTMFDLARRYSKGNVLMVTRNSKPDTCFRYFCLVFPRPDNHLKVMANEMVEGRSRSPFRKMAIWTAYMFYMANMIEGGRDKEATEFYQLLERTFFTAFRMMPYIGPDSKFVVLKYWYNN